MDVPAAFIYTAAELIAAALAMALVIAIAEHYENKRPKKPWGKKK
jgi:hypothetical protein